MRKKRSFSYLGIRGECISRRVHETKGGRSAKTSSLFDEASGEMPVLHRGLAQVLEQITPSAWHHNLQLIYCKLCGIPSYLGVLRGV